MRVLCMSHGKLADGLINSAKMILGDVTYLDSISVYVDGKNNLQVLIDNYLKKHKNETLYILTDIFGGSVNNQWMNYVNKIPNLYLITGMNLNILVQLIIELNKNTNKTIPENYLKKLVNQPLCGCRYCNSISMNDNNQDF